MGNLIIQAVQSSRKQLGFYFIVIFLFAGCSNKEDDKGQQNFQNSRKVSLDSSTQEFTSSNTLTFTDSEQDTSSLEVFFETIRVAFLQKNAKLVAKKIKMPITIKGSLDEYPDFYIKDELNLEDFLNEYLSEEFVCNGLVITKQVMLRQKKCFKENKISNDYRQIGDFLFSRINNSWRLEWIYSDVFSGG